MNIESGNASGCNTKYWTTLTSFAGHFSEGFGERVNEIRLPCAGSPIDIDPQWSRVFTCKCPAIMVDYTKENAALVIDKICDDDIRDILMYDGQPFFTFQITLSVPQIFDGCIIVVQIKV